MFWLYGTRGKHYNYVVNLPSPSRPMDLNDLM
jgi:hypothetical protein